MRQLAGTVRFMGLVMVDAESQCTGALTPNGTRFAQDRTSMSVTERLMRQKDVGAEIFLSHYSLCQKCKTSTGALTPHRRRIQE